MYILYLAGAYTIFLTRTDDFSPSFFVAAPSTFATTSLSSCLQECSRTWHPWGLLYGCIISVFMVMFCFWTYHRQLLSKLDFQWKEHYAYYMVMFTCTCFYQLYICTGNCAFRLWTTGDFRRVSQWNFNNSSFYNMWAIDGLIHASKTGLGSRSPWRSPWVFSLTSSKYRPRYLCGLEGIFVFGDCMFRVDPSGLLTRNGSCPTQSGELTLSDMSIKALAPDVFSNLSSVRWLMCCVMKYVPTTQHVFSKWREDLAGKCSVVTTVSTT